MTFTSTFACHMLLTPMDFFFESIKSKFYKLKTEIKVLAATTCQMCCCHNAKKWIYILQNKNYSYQQICRISGNLKRYSPFATRGQQNTISPRQHNFSEMLPPCEEIWLLHQKMK